MTYLNSSLAELAQQIPGATAVFNKYQLSFCCGGKSTLKQAIADADLEQEDIIEALSSLDRKSNDILDWDNASDEILIDYFVTHFHQAYPAQLSELHRLADRVETVHGSRPECPQGLAAHVQQTTLLLQGYVQSEQNLYSLLQNVKAADDIVFANIAEQQANLNVALSQIDELTNNITPPEGACNTWRALYLGLNAFKADLQRHLDLANNNLFSRHIAKTTEIKETADKPVHGEDYCCGSCGGD